MDPLHLSWARSHLGPLQVDDTTAGPWRLLPDVGPPAWLKRLRSGRAWAQADGAHEQVLPALRAAGVAVPVRLARWPRERVLLLSELPGRPGTLDDPPEVFEAVGRILGVLHALPCPEDPIPLPAAMVARAGAAAARWPGRVSSAVLEHLGDGAAFREGRVWCHRDLQPRNWIVAPDGVGLVDFEHLRPDHRTADFVRLAARGIDGARLEALQRGYGATPDLTVALRLYGLQTVVWARDHGDAELEAIGLAALSGP